MVQLQKSRSRRYLYRLRLRFEDNGRKADWYLLVSDHTKIESFIENLEPGAIPLSNELIAFEAETLPDRMNFFVDLTKE